MTKTRKIRVGDRVRGVFRGAIREGTVKEDPRRPGHPLVIHGMIYVVDDEGRLFHLANWERVK